MQHFLILLRYFLIRILTEVLKLKIIFLKIGKIIDLKKIFLKNCEMFDIFHNWNNKNIRYTDNNKKFIIYIKYTKVLLLRMENDLQIFFCLKIFM